MAVICLLALTAYLIISFKSSMRVLSHADYVAGVEYTVCRFLNTQKEFVTSDLVNYIECNYPNIIINNGEVCDKNNRPMRITINDATNSFHVKVSSSGKDGVWGTKDDLKRDGYLEKELPHAEPVVAYQEVPRSIGLCFDSLLAWQAGDTNQFHRLLHENEYDSHLRDVVRNSIKKGSDDEVLRMVNLFLNNWIVVEAGHSRSYEWPDRETDRTAWELLSRIRVNRQQHPCSTGDVDVDATLNRILDRTSEKDSSGHKGTTP